MGACADMALSEGRPAGVRSRAWHWLFSSQHKTTALCGGCKIKPDDFPVFLLERQIVGQLEAPDPVRRNAVRRSKPLTVDLLSPV
jgi:hypothetical protein